MKILAFGAHPDDIEIFMFGLLCAYKEQKHEIFLAIATDGSKGEEKPSKNLADIRLKETKAALEPLGNPIMLGLKDGELSYTNEAEKIIKNYIKSINPDIIITHYKNDYHPDHRSLSSYIQNAVGFSIPIIFCDTLMGLGFQPNIYFNITNYINIKRKAILLHKSQKPEKYVYMTEIMNKFRASQCNLLFDKFAEAFIFEPKYPFGDIRSLLPTTDLIRPHKV